MQPRTGTGGAAPSPFLPLSGRGRTTGTAPAPGPSRSPPRSPASPRSDFNSPEQPRPRWPSGPIALCGGTAPTPPPQRTARGATGRGLRRSATCTGRPRRCWGSRPVWSPWGNAAHPDAAKPEPRYSGGGGAPWCPPCGERGGEAGEWQLSPPIASLKRLQGAPAWRRGLTRWPNQLASY